MKPRTDSPFGVVFSENLLSPTHPPCAYALIASLISNNAVNVGPGRLRAIKSCRRQRPYTQFCDRFHEYLISGHFPHLGYRFRPSNISSMHIDGVHRDPSGHHVSVIQSFFS